MVAVFRYANGLRFLGVAKNEADAIYQLYKRHYTPYNKSYFYRGYEKYDGWDNVVYYYKKKGWKQCFHIEEIKENW